MEFEIIDQTADYALVKMPNEADGRPVSIRNAIHVLQELRDKHGLQPCLNHPMNSHMVCARVRPS